MTPATVHLGYEVGTGTPVAIPLANMFVAGMTQAAGKTTTLEALVARAGRPAIAFVTKRGESAFQRARRIPPYFRDRADWQFVNAILEAVLQEKQKFLRPWIMKACKGKYSLGEVRDQVRDELAHAKGFREGIYTELAEYLDLIVPDIERAELASGIELRPGANVMDVTDFSAPMQMLFVRSALDWVHHKETGVITVIPEAWEMVPNGKNTPVKAMAELVCRKGSVLQNFVWADSQDLAAVDMLLRRGTAVWLLGVQRETQEIKRNLDMIPLPRGSKPKPEDVALLERGQFFACWGSELRKVYVQPAWMDDAEAIAIARGERHPAPRRFFQEMSDELPPARRQEEDPAMCQEHARLADIIADRDREIVNLNATLERTAREARNAGDAQQTVDALRAAFGQLGIYGGDAKAPVVAEDAIVDRIAERVLARIPAGGAVIQVTPPEKLRADFQRDEVARILDDVRSWSPLKRLVLKFLIATDKQMSAREVAARTGKARNGDFANVFKELVGAGYLESKPNGYEVVLHQKLADYLSAYRPSIDDVEKVYQRIVHALATGESAAA